MLYALIFYPLNKKQYFVKATDFFSSEKKKRENISDRKMRQDVQNLILFYNIIIVDCN